MNPDKPTRASAAGSCHRSVAAHEFGAVGGDRFGAPVDVGESHAAGEVGAEGVPRQQCAGLDIDLGDDVHRGRVAGRTQDPLGIISRRQPSPSIAHVADSQPDQLDRVVGRAPTGSARGSDRVCSVQTWYSPVHDAPASAPPTEQAAGWGTTHHRYLHRANRRSHPAGRRRGHYSRASAGSSGCSPTR